MAVVVGRYCVFSHKNKQYSRYFRLSPDGQIQDIGGEGHDNERYWDVENHQIRLFSKDKQLTATFTCCYEEEFLLGRNASANHSARVASL